MIGGKGSPAPVREKIFSPSEFSVELSEFGISLCEKLIRVRCALPEADPLHIKSLPGFPGRWFIPQSEAYRLASLKEATA